MFKIILFLVWSWIIYTLGTDACHSMTIQQLDVIYNKLVSENHLKGAKYKYIIKSNIINAGAAKDGGLFITSAAMEKLTEPEMAWLLGHELTHIQFRNNKCRGRKCEEDRADYYGQIYASKSGYSRCQQALLLLRFYKLYGNEGGSEDPHSTNLKRFWNIYKGCKLNVHN